MESKYTKLISKYHIINFFLLTDAKNCAKIHYTMAKKKSNNYAKLKKHVSDYDSELVEVYKDARVEEERLKRRLRFLKNLIDKSKDEFEQYLYVTPTKIYIIPELTPDEAQELYTNLVKNGDDVPLLLEELIYEYFSEDTDKLDKMIESK